MLQSSTGGVGKRMNRAVAQPPWLAGPRLETGPDSGLSGIGVLRVLLTEPDAE